MTKLHILYTHHAVLPPLSESPHNRKAEKTQVSLNLLTKDGCAPKECVKP